MLITVLGYLERTGFKGLDVLSQPGFTFLASQLTWMTSVRVVQADMVAASQVR